MYFIQDIYEYKKVVRDIEKLSKKCIHLKCIIIVKSMFCKCHLSCCRNLIILGETVFDFLLKIRFLLISVGLINVYKRKVVHYFTVHNVLCS